MPATINSHTATPKYWKPVVAVRQQEQSPYMVQVRFTRSGTWHNYFDCEFREGHTMGRSSSLSCIIGEMLGEPQS